MKFKQRLLVLFTIVILFFAFLMLKEEKIDNYQKSTGNLSNVYESLQKDYKVGDESPSTNDLTFDFSYLLEEGHLNTLNLSDLTMGFSSFGSVRKIIDSAQSMGIEVLETIPELASLRFRVVDLPKAMESFAHMEEGFELSQNYKIRLPSLPEPKLVFAEKGFGDDAMNWLGVPRERSTWGKDIKVAILDSGVDAEHPLLEKALIERVQLVNQEEVVFKGHGTAIASIIGGRSTDFAGIAPSTSLLSIEVLDQFGEGSSFTVAKGIIEAVNRGAKVINLSLGGEIHSTVLQQAVTHAIENGSILVAAVGNQGRAQVTYPASYEGVVGVGSVDRLGRSSSFSNSGKEVDLAAPGVMVKAAWEKDEMVSFSGTSASTAFVSGAMAALLSEYPILEENQIMDLVYDYSNEAEKPGFDPWTGHGILNIGRIIMRNQESFADAAIVGYYFDPKDLGGAGTTPFLVTIQNQGNRWLNNMRLSVDYNGMNRNYLFNNLSPGETRSERLYLNDLNRGQPIEIISTLSLDGGDDQNLRNNIRESIITLPALD